ncbi:TPA: V-type ATP synthase subunit F [Candidatus Woesearchaeota archaeon]|nr:V-type ATP synthase subunit F [archaeon]HIJ11407.1 V-type ATP synthase subunit F [Candidatus Woesearchaeota archaeon]|tara:strand:+ start:202 stop:495 length:294 start_codon:yes stop_codon:yes gene_type:complete
MKSIAVMGESEFTLGFRLAGIRDVITKDGIENVLSSSDIGIVIIDQGTFDSYDERMQDEISASLQPVFVVLAEEHNQEALRKMIVQSIGVDLLKDEN